MPDAVGVMELDAQMGASWADGPPCLAADDDAVDMVSVEVV
jgi:hypothetical protein